MPIENLSPDDSGDDLSRGYQQHAQAQSVDATIEGFLRQTRNAAPMPKPVEPVPVPRIVAPPKSVWEHVGSVASDVAYGTMVEGPKAVVGGVNDAVRNAVNGMNDLADWMSENVGGNVPVPSTGSQTVDKIIQKPLTALSEALSEALPEKIKEPTTVTGHVIREGARFLVGFVPALRMFGRSVPGVAAAGAMSDFATMDPDAAGLSNLVQSVPALQNPIAEYLATDPNSNEALNRLRHGVEGAGMGFLAEGVVRGVRALANTRQAAPQVAAQQSLYGSVNNPAQLLVAKETEPLVTIGEKLAKSVKATDTGVPSGVAAKGVAASAEEHANRAGLARVLRTSDEPSGVTGTEAVASGPDVYVNFGRINTSDDVKQVIRDMADAFKGDINEARRGVQSNEHTARLADDLGMTVDDLLTRQKGQPFNAEQSLAARRLLNTSAEKLLELAQKAADPTASLADQFNFRRMMALHHAVQSEVIAARTETARALQSWSIPAGGNIEMARNIQMLMDGAGGSMVSTEMAKRMAALIASGASPGAVANAARRGWAATTMDAVKESFVLGLLWNPSTHIVNVASSIAVAFQQIYERGAAAKLGNFLGTSVDARVVDGEALAMTYGLINSLKDAFRLAGKSLKTGQTGASLGKIDLPHDPAIGSASISRELGHNVVEAQQFAETAVGRGIDFIGATVRAPGRLLGSSDEFFKTIGYQMEVHAQALRQSAGEGNSGSNLWRRMLEIVNDPPEHIRISAADAALYNTFTNKPGEWAQALMNLRNAGSLNPTFLVLPFLRTPANILRYSFERSPIAPLVGQWRADIAAGGARRDLALSRMATGTSIMAIGLDLAADGIITGTGPSDAGKREALMRQGWQPNSVKVDDKYYSFSRGDPVGMALSAAGTIGEMLKSKEMSPEDFDTANELLAASIGVVSTSIVDKTFFKGVSDFATMIHESNRGDAGVTNWLNKQAGSLLPFSSALNLTKRFADPVTREANSPWDAIQARIAGMSERLPPARNLWGEERKPDEVYGRTYDVLSPVAVSQAKDSPIDAEMERLQMSVKRIQRRGVFSGGDIDFRDYPQAYDAYVRLAGNELKHPVWGLGAKDFLDAVVEGRNSSSGIYQIYSDGPEGGKASFIKNTISEYRALAQQKIMSDPQYADFADHVWKRKERRQELRAPLQGMKPPSVRLGGPLQ